MNSKITKLEYQRNSVTQESQRERQETLHEQEELHARIKELEKMLKLKDIKHSKMYERMVYDMN